ncbi:hypothetical protein PFISCL1PPCAC_11425, partial [Pristionchus fissidentatus]
SFQMILLLLLSVVSISSQQELSTNLTQQLYRPDGSVAVVSSVSCSIKKDERRDCETCVAKGTGCFWCGDNDSCLPYEWYFPGCGLPHVQYSSCWVNWSAVAIVVAILAGILLVLIFVCVCCCCCKLRAARQRRNQKAGERREAKMEASRTAMEMMQTERRAKREKEMEEYRMKYGIPKKTIE